MTRIVKENYYLDIAQAVAGRGTCLRRNFGAIIVKHDQILSTGYVGAPRGRRNGGRGHPRPGVSCEPGSGTFPPVSLPF